MTFSITIRKSTSKQYGVLKKLPNDNLCRDGDTATIYGVYEPAKRVDDVFRYTLRLSRGNQTQKLEAGGNIGAFSDELAIKSKNRKIVLVVESPHSHEYDENFVPIAPAQGSTGDNIHKHIIGIIDRHNRLNLPDGDYDLIICNPVQFQASLFHLHKIPLRSKEFDVTAVRNKVWRAIYNLDKNTFYQRLTTYAPAAIINACTSNLRKRACCEIERWRISTTNVSQKQLNVYNAGSHPQNWSSNTMLTPFT
jgi:hypothetical protein